MRFKHMLERRTGTRETAAETRERLLDTAETLFADEGLAATSLRAITAAAGVNVAAVHYHFGSKEALLEAVFARRIAPVNRERLARLARHEAAAAGGRLDVEAVLEAFIAPLIEAPEPPGMTPERLSALVGRFYTEPRDLVERILRDQFADLGRRFILALCRALPDLEPAEVAWRFQCMLGVLSHILSGRHRLDVIPGFRPDATDARETLRRAVAFCAAGVRAQPAANVGGAR
jgi:AcrR family transcriptional regulator